MRQVLPDEYRELSELELTERIKGIKRKLGDELIILTHHYQRQEIVDLGDFSGDSFKLSKQAAQHPTARFIVFCGVDFMAESAAILAREGQAVFIPEREAGCPMAGMSKYDEVERAWAELGRHAAKTTPLTYVNSTADIKAFCGAHRGATCTSSNAHKLFEWAMTRGEKIFFMPDEHLGRNTAARLGLAPVALWDPGKESGGLGEKEIAEARVFVWKGYCHVHTRFSVEQVKRKREEFPGCKVIVHPECKREVVEASDASGSTEEIISYTAEQPRGSAIVIGTETHLVDRLRRKYEGTKTVVPLCRSICPNMYKISLQNLCWVMEEIAAGPDRWVNRVTVAEDIKRDAAKALSVMLEKG